MTTVAELISGATQKPETKDVTVAELISGATQKPETKDVTVAELISGAKQAPGIQERIVGLPGVSPQQTIKTLIGTGQEMAQFAANISNLMSRIPGVKEIDYRVPEIVKTGISEKALAGIIEYLAGGGLAKALPFVQKGVQAARAIPGIGRALAAPITQRAAGSALMEAIERPEEPLKAAAFGATLAPAAELGIKYAPTVPRKAIDFMTKTKFSPFHKMMMPHIRTEFNQYINTIGNALELTPEHDVDKAIFDHLSSKYDLFSAEGKVLYNAAHTSFGDIKYPINFKKLLKNQVKPLFEKENVTYEGTSLKEKVINPVNFKRELHALQSKAYRDANIDLANSLNEIETGFDDVINKYSPENEELTNALGLLRTADKYFKENIVPLRETKQVTLAGGKRKSIPTEFFKAYGSGQSKGLAPKMLNNIQDLEHMNKIAPGIKNYLSFSNFKGGFDKPHEFIEQFSKMTKDQKEILFDEKTLKRLNKYKTIYGKNPEAFKKHSFALPTGAMSAAALASTFVPYGTAVTPFALGGLGAIGGAKLLSRFPGIREAYISGAPAAAAMGPTQEMLAKILTGGLIGTTQKINEEIKWLLN